MTSRSSEVWFSARRAISAFIYRTDVLPFTKPLASEISCHNWWLHYSHCMFACSRCLVFWALSRAVKHFPISSEELTFPDGTKPLKVQLPWMLERGRRWRTSWSKLLDCRKTDYKCPIVSTSVFCYHHIRLSTVGDWAFPVAAARTWNSIVHFYYTWCMTSMWLNECNTVGFLSNIWASC